MLDMLVDVFKGRGRAITVGVALPLMMLALVWTAQAAQFGFSKPDSSSSGPRFAKKDCLDCHKKFADKYLGMKNVHAVVKQKNCEGCHLRHGIVPKLLLKKDGNEVCFSCHTKDKIGMNRSNVHTVLKRGKCITCHDPHASPAAHLLKKEGNEACYECHKKEDYEKKVVHKTGSAKGCTPTFWFFQLTILVTKIFDECSAIL